MEFEAWWIKPVGSGRCRRWSWKATRLQGLPKADVLHVWNACQSGHRGRLKREGGMSAQVSHLGGANQITYNNRAQRHLPRDTAHFTHDARHTDTSSSEPASANGANERRRCVARHSVLTSPSDGDSGSTGATNHHRHPPPARRLPALHGRGLPLRMRDMLVDPVPHLPLLLQISRGVQR